MRKILSISIITLILLTSVIAAAFMGTFDDADRAYANARKGALWGMNNLRVKKTRTENKLIENNQLLSIVKIEKEINGVRVFARGFDGTTEVSIEMFRTFESLLREGFIDKNYLPKNEDE